MMVVHDIVMLVGWTAPFDTVTIVIGGVSHVTGKLDDVAPNPTPFIEVTVYSCVEPEGNTPYGYTWTNVLISVV